MCEKDFPMVGESDSVPADRARLGRHARAAIVGGPSRRRTRVPSLVCATAVTEDSCDVSDDIVRIPQVSCYCAFRSLENEVCAVC